MDKILNIPHTHHKKNEPFSFSWMDRLSLIFFAWIFLFSTLIFALNFFVWHYTPLNYFSEGMIFLFCFLLFSTLGCFFSKGFSFRPTQIFFYLTLYHIIICLVMYATVAVQLTPFAVIDRQLLAIDRAFHYDSIAILNFLAEHLEIRKILSQAYNFINIELLALPLCILILKQFDSIKQYFFLVLSTTLIGFAIYFFWPTMAPASVLKSAYFLEAQRNTGLKFYQLHHYITPESGSGGLVSMPSFHIMWAILCQHSAWRVKWLWCGILPMNTLVILSALFLGWHYLADFWGSLFVIAAACSIAWCYKKMTLSRFNTGLALAIFPVNE